MDILSLCHTNDLLSHTYWITLVPAYHIVMAETDYTCFITVSLYEHHHVSNHRLDDFLFMCYCNLALKEILKVQLLSVCEGYLPMTGGFSPQRASDAETASMSWRHYKNIERHTAHTIVSWSNSKQSILFHIFVISMKYTNDVIVYQNFKKNKPTR